MRRLILAAVIGMAAIPSVAAAHDRAPGAYMVVIPVRDLDLGTPAGAAALRDRFARAIWLRTAATTSWARWSGISRPLPAALRRWRPARAA